MLTCKQFHELHKMVDLIYKEADRIGVNNPALAKKAGLSYTTVRKLSNYSTMYPRTQTVMMLARAVGFEVRLERSEKAFRLVG